MSRARSMTLPYQHDTSACFEARVAEGGLDKAAWDHWLTGAERALKRLAERVGTGELPILDLPGKREDLDALAGTVERFRSFTDVLVLGIGGSSLGGRTIYSLTEQAWNLPGSGPRMHFVESIDPDTWRMLFRSLDLSRTGFIVISKSGSTAETLAQFLTVLAKVEKLPGFALSEHVAVITEAKENPLRQLAGRLDVAALEHDPNVGGRFSALSLVGLLPAMIAGIDAGAIREGAREVIEATVSASSAEEAPPAEGAALLVGMMRERAVSQSVLMPYLDRLGDFGFWYRQLWAESLGKDGQGSTPIRAMGPVDQHSQLQLYLSGPRDKVFTLVIPSLRGEGLALSDQVSADRALHYLEGRTLADLMAAEAEATAETLVNNGRPTRILRIGTVDARVMGALLMHFMLETILAADLMNVNAFDQPAVEEGKILARQYLLRGRDA